MLQDFYQNGKWTISRLLNGRWQLEELIKTEDQLGALILSTNLSNEDLLTLQQAAESALGREPCAKCQTTHPLDGPHHPVFEKWVRSLADYDNLLKRNSRDLSQAQYEASKKILVELLPMMDNIRTVFTALQHGGVQRTKQCDGICDCVDCTLCQGKDLSPEEARIIESSLDNMLQKNEVVALFPGMKPLPDYNPEYHQAIEIMEDDVPSSRVVPLMQGYLWRGKLLRTAQVKIVQPRAIKPPAEASDV